MSNLLYSSEDIPSNFLTPSDRQDISTTSEGVKEMLLQGNVEKGTLHSKKNKARPSKKSLAAVVDFLVDSTMRKLFKQFVAIKSFKCRLRKYVNKIAP